jgi:transposase
MDDKQRESVKARIAEKTIKENDCLVWIGCRTQAGYGLLSVNSKAQYVHRLTWRIANGPIPEGMCICHHCDNPPCVNVDHLFLGTQADNVADMAAKGRASRIARHKKLSKDKVIRMRALFATGNYRRRELATMFGVSEVSSILSGKTWSNIPLPYSEEEYQRLRHGFKLGKNDVTRIIALRKDGLLLRRIAKMFDVDESVISRICNRESHSSHYS